jgi:hypothetical protein
MPGMRGGQTRISNDFVIAAQTSQLLMLWRTSAASTRATPLRSRTVLVSLRVAQGLKNPDGKWRRRGASSQKDADESIDLSTFVLGSRCFLEGVGERTRVKFGHRPRFECCPLRSTVYGPGIIVGYGNWDA